MRGNQGKFLGDILSWATSTPSSSLLYSTIILYDSVHKNISLRGIGCVTFICVTVVLEYVTDIQRFFGCS